MPQTTPIPTITSQKIMNLLNLRKPPKRSDEVDAAAFAGRADHHLEDAPVEHHGEHRRRSGSR